MSDDQDGAGPLRSATPDDEHGSFPAALASLGEAVATIDAEGRVLSLNRVAENLSGWTDQEARGRPIAEVLRLIDDESREPVENPGESALRARQVASLRERTLTVARNGPETPVDVSAAPIRDDAGDVHGAVLVFRSVAERKQNELSHARLAAIVESSQDAIVSKTLDSRIVSWNAAAEQLFGYTADEAVGQPVTMLIPPDRHDEERVILERLGRGERIEHYETVRLAKSGRRIEVSLTISPVRDRSGRIVGASKIARDITARRRAERRLTAQHRVAEALAESGDLHEAAPRILASICESLEGQFAALWTVSEAPAALRCVETSHVPDTRFERFEAATRQRVLEPGRGLPGRVWASAAAVRVADVTRDDNFTRTAAAAEEGLHGALAFPIVLYANVLGVVEVFSREVREPDEADLEAMESIGSQIGQFVERKKAEALLRESEQRLVASLEEADRRKDEFLAVLSHELRNPLAPIRNAVQIFRAKDSPEPELRWATEVIDRQLHHMTRMVDDLLDVSRITQGKVELCKETVKLQTVVDNAIDASRPLIEKAGHDLTVSLPPHPVHLHADPTRLAQMISNLLNNAAKYTARRGRIALTAEEGDGEIRIRVRDNGIGISAEMLPRVFELFTQGGGSVEQSDGGLGIGLTLVRTLAEMHGGSVEAHSGGTGRGSEFVVRLPASSAVDEARTGAEAQAPAATRALRILVVDDNPDSADSLAMVLRLMGHDVDTAFDGLQAVGAASAFHPDIVLLDIGLPKMSGHEAARRIREQVGARPTVLVALTGWGHEEDRRRSREAGFDHHMTKPVDFRTLQKLLVGLQAQR